MSRTFLFRCLSLRGMRAVMCVGAVGILSLSQPATGQRRGGHGAFGGAPATGTFPHTDIGARSPLGSPPNVEQSGRSDRGTENSLRGGLQLGPPARWWDDKHFVKQLKLRPEQQRRMDSIFEQNRTVLLKRYETLEQEEQRMHSLMHASTLDENALMAQIDRVEQARADLAKAQTHYLFQIRSEMDPGQLSHLEEHP